MVITPLAVTQSHQFRSQSIGRMRHFLLVNNTLS